MLTWMNKFFRVLLLISFYATTSFGQRATNKHEQIIFIVDPCAIPWPKGSRPPENPQTRITANLKSIKTPNAGKVNRANPRNYPKPNLAVKIKLLRDYIYSFNDLKIVLTIKNETSREQTFMFDKWDGASTILFETDCDIVNSYGRSVVRHHNRAILDTASYYKNIETYYYTLRPAEWLLKEYSVSNLVVLDTIICRKNKLPPGPYTIQLNIQDNVSNTVSFRAE